MGITNDKHIIQRRSKERKLYGFDHYRYINIRVNVIYFYFCFKHVRVVIPINKPILILLHVTNGCVTERCDIFYKRI